MEQFDPVLKGQLKVGREILHFGISANAGALSGYCGGDVHNHSRFELHIILNGRCQVDVEGVSHVLKAGQAIVVSPGQFHRAVGLTEDHRRLTVGLTPDGNGLRCALDGAAGICVISPHIEELCRSILAESDAQSDFCLELMRVQLTELVIRFLRLWNLRGDQQPDVESQASPQDVIDTYFEVNMGKNPSADDLARRLHISRRHLNRILQTIYGMGFREKLLGTRMDQAKWLLRHTDKSVGVIAVEVGYTYDSAFRQAFRRQFGITPQTYRLSDKRTKETERNEDI